MKDKSEVFLVLERSDCYDHSFSVRAFSTLKEALMYRDSVGTCEWEILITKILNAEETMAQRASEIEIYEREVNEHQAHMKIYWEENEKYKTKRDSAKTVEEKAECLEEFRQIMQAKIPAEPG